MIHDCYTGKRPRGAIAVGAFFLWGSVMASLAAITLMWRGTALDRIWLLHPRGYRQLVPFGNCAGTLFFVLAVGLSICGVGWLNRRLWAWPLELFASR
jgi:hypothetical protein